MVLFNSYSVGAVRVSIVFGNFSGRHALQEFCPELSGTGIALHWLANLLCTRGTKLKSKISLLKSIGYVLEKMLASEI